jgi:hypothetical protein
LTPCAAAVRLADVLSDLTDPGHATPWRDVVRRGVVIVGAGIATGVLTLLGQAVLDGDWNRLANSGAIWLSVAFGVGASMASDRQAAVAGLATLFMALLGYQIAAALTLASMSTSAFFIWSATAIVGGPLFGLAGRLWRVGNGRGPIVAIALLGAVYLAEGLNTLLSIPDLARAGWLEVVAGLVLPMLLARSWRERRGALLLLVPLSLAGVLVYRAIDLLFQLA